MEINNFIFNLFQDKIKYNYINFSGIKLYFDDLILAGLIYLLFNEKCDDTFLYIVLIMLLF